MWDWSLCMCVPAAPHKCVHRWSRAVCELLMDARRRLVRGFMRSSINGCLRARPAAAISANLEDSAFWGRTSRRVRIYFLRSTATVFTTSDNGLLLAQCQVSNV